MNDILIILILCKKKNITLKRVLTISLNKHSPTLQECQIL